MIRVHVFRTPLSIGVHRPVRRDTVAWTGQSAASIAIRYLDLLPKDVRVGVTVAGHKLTKDELALPLGDDVDVVIAPDPEGILEWIGFALLSALISTAVSYAYTALVGTPKDAEIPADRGEDSSATYAWDRIATDYRPGFPVPLLFGEHDTGGQVIHAQILAAAGGGGAAAFEELRIVLALSEGRIEAIGGVTGGEFGEIDSLGGIEGQTGTPPGALPEDIRVSGNRLDHTEQYPGARAYLRMGEIDQRPLPQFDSIAGSSAFVGVSKIDVVSADLTDSGSSAIHTITDVALINYAEVILTFPAGLYEQDPQGNILPYALDFKIWWRQVGTTQWLGGQTFTVAPISPPLQQFSINQPFAPALNGPLEVKVERLTAAGGTGVVSRCLWRQIVYGTRGQQFSYPRTALCGLILHATENATGTRADFTFRVKGMRVRVWDASINGGDPSGFDHWEAPGGADPYAGIWTYPPGRNPAWILATFLTHRAGLGMFIHDADIDWPAFRDWADFCDQSVSVDGGTEALCQFDGVLDSPQSAWDWMLRICQAGRAVPVLRGSQISVVYQYRDAHGRGTNSVPAKGRTQLIATTNVRKFTAEYFNTEDRPAVLEAQFLNRDKDFAQDTIPVDDPDGGHEDPTEINPIGYQKKTVRMFGVTRPTQIRRELLFQHRVNARIRSQVSFEIGPEALGATVGDLIGVQHDVLRPYDSQAFALRVLTGGTGLSALQLDRDVELAVGVSYAVLVREDDGTVAERSVTAGDGSYPRGTPISISGTVDVKSAAPLVLGEVNKLVKDYVVAGITLTEDLFREVRAMEWVPSVYDALNVGEAESGGGLFAPGGTLPAGTPQEADFASNALPLFEDATGAGVAAFGIRLLRLPNRGGSYAIVWSRPAGYGNALARVFVRLAGGSTWVLAGESRNSMVELPLTPLESYEIAVAIQNKSGTFPLPDQAGVVTQTADEFPLAPPPLVQKLAAGFEDGACRLTWQRIRSSAVEAIEVRKDSWLGGVVLAEVPAELDTVAIPLLPVTSDSQQIKLLVRARSRDGLYSPRAATVTVNPPIPDHLVAGSAVNFDPSNADSIDLDWALGIGEYLARPKPWIGTWVTEEIVVGYDAEQTVAVDARTNQAYSLETIDDHDYAVDSGEAMWRLVDGRPASLFRPGIELDETIDDFDMPIDDVDPNRRVGTWKGNSGVEMAQRIYYRHALTAESISSAPWQRYSGPFKATFGRIQAKLLLARDGSGWFFEVAAFALRRYLG